MVCGVVFRLAHPEDTIVETLRGLAAECQQFAEAFADPSEYDAKEVGQAARDVNS